MYIFGDGYGEVYFKNLIDYVIMLFYDISKFNGEMYRLFVSILFIYRFFLKRMFLLIIFLYYM